MLDLVLCGESIKRVNVTNDTEALVPPDRYHPPLDITMHLPRRHLPFTARIGRSIPTSPTHTEHSDRVVKTYNYDFRRADFVALYDLFLKIDWSDVTCCTEVDMATEIFYSKLYDCFNQTVPIKQCNREPRRFNYPCWFTQEIKSNLKSKSYHHKNFKSSGNDDDKDLFKSYRSLIKKQISEAYESYLGRVEHNIRKDPKTFWKYINENKKDRFICKEYLYNGEQVSEQEAADSFADYFSSVFLPEIPKLDPQLAEAEAARFLDNESTRIAVDRISLKDLQKAVKKMKPSNSPGPDGVPPFIVKDCISILEIPLLHLYNLSLQQGKYPTRWKISRVMPVPKEDDKSSVEKYRPIAILSVFGKLFESILDQDIRKQIKILLHDSQHGFRPNRSTATNHLVFIDSLTAMMDDKKQIDVAYFDFMKAFDRVDNDVLLSKLASFGFSPNMVKFFSSYLGDRSQYVQLDGFKSAPYYTRSGISQGSTLGPTQFLIMINDLPQALQAGSRCLMFADDLKLYSDISTDNDCLAL